MADFSMTETRPGLLSLAGELVVSDAPELKALLLTALGAHRRLEVDMLNVTRIDTAGVQLLVMLRREALAQQRELVWLGYSLAIEEVLELLDLSHVVGRPAGVVWS